MSKQLDPDVLWKEVSLRLYKTTGPVSFEAMIAPLTPIGFKDGKLVLSVPADHAADIIQAWNTQQYAMDFVQHANEITGDFIRPELKVEEDSEAETNSNFNGYNEPTQIPFSQENDLNSDFTFDKFVKGAGNENALAVALAVAEAPGKVYNPFLIYGGVGLGKTHLMQSIGNEYATTHPNASIKYATAEDFLNDFTDSLREGNKADSNATAKFKKTYRSLDMLLIDDIQFWSGKEKVQEEFFNTFNALTKAGKQIVMTSDRYPTDIPDLLTRLTSRFEAGITQDIQKPDLPTRVAILRNLQERNDLDIPNEVLELIGEKIDTNVRSLEGAFHKFEAKIRFMNKPATIETAQSILTELNIDQGKKITVERIQETVANYFMQTIADMQGSRRQADLVTARHIAIYLTRTMTNKSLPDIGRSFGGRDHSSISHAYNKVAEQVETEPKTKELIEDLANEIKNGK
ncbi:chromosomal replication initiator protein DnaA [Fructobacillus tropaeoli]|uniref:Chromosomal replication initiator protein DnaA n=1 Tax=Fructobacillus tropaeoli TaxID=709323 RepID=A0A3F3HC62_9LACO|nr:chromosomal replication initiator protein DnaA [Fructobacillus tropaeoli]NLS38534.1 chromosomal replication initiator protein DnaA [Fructobacillus tropaeoli]GAP04650.1 chromosomal replication initiation protein [Fructobacillus tropaeoli]GIC70435.1 chromosomal replication initiator protein DnaA [Fructobacillus tropaeoli]CAK1244993.1 Chromosomal replication initiation ATPase DnaA (DnaA) [Fructobacillus tropaeoli]